MRIIPYGNSGLLCEFQEGLTHSLNSKIHSLSKNIKELHGVLYVVPSYTTIAVYFDKTLTNHNKLYYLIEDLEKQDVEPLSSTTWDIPICYELGLDTQRIADHLSKPAEETISMHVETKLYVYGYGFLPGMPKMGETSVSAPGRLSTPRHSVPSGSVGWVNDQCSIYPQESPGGWNIIGRSPKKFFDLNNPDPCLVKPGDFIQFYRITENHFNAYDRV